MRYGCMLTLFILGITANQVPESNEQNNSGQQRC
jgi:hypothetical protein